MVSFRQTIRDLLRSISANEPPLDGTAALWPIGWKDAEARGTELLIRNLSAKQREQYRNCGHFDVFGGDTGRRYRIQRGYQLNIEELDQRGRRIRMWCFMPEGRVPVGDVMLAQKIALELFESEALKVANRSPMGDYTLEEALPFVRRYPRR
jgi:hypothetical protein